jgi:hypothetical protein
MDSLKFSLRDAIPQYQTIFFKEAFNVKVIVKCAMEGFISILKGEGAHYSFSIDRVKADYLDLLGLFKSIVLDDWIDMDYLRGEDRLAFAADIHFLPATEKQKWLPIQHFQSIFSL